MPLIHQNRYMLYVILDTHCLYSALIFPVDNTVTFILPIACDFSHENILKIIYSTYCIGSSLTLHHRLLYNSMTLILPSVSLNWWGSLSTMRNSIGRRPGTSASGPLPTQTTPSSLRHWNAGRLLCYSISYHVTFKLFLRLTRDTWR